MGRTKTAGLRVVVLLALGIAGAASYSAEPGRNTLSAEEVAKQQAIYSSKGDATPDGYVVGRSLLSYGYILPDDFKRSLGSLGGKDRWLDIGAGEGRAVMDYCMARYDSMFNPGGADLPAKKARAIAMSIEDRRTPVWYQTAKGLEADQIQYLFGKTLREYTPAELGRFQVITDVLGGFSYTQDLTLFMEKTLGFLEVNGSFYTVLQDVHWEQGANKPFYPDARFLTEITDADGSEVKMCTWLKSISCVEVTCEPKTGWKPPLEVYHVRKVCENVTVPPMTRVHFEAGTPPERGFKLTKTPAPKAEAKKD